MARKIITTPEGKKHVASFSEVFQACVIDVVFIILLINAYKYFVEDINTVRATITALFYFYLSRKLNLSLAWWVMCLRAYEYKDIEEYNGSGSLTVSDPDSSDKINKRIFIIMPLFIFLYGATKLHLL